MASQQLMNASVGAMGAGSSRKPVVKAKGSPRKKEKKVWVGEIGVDTFHVCKDTIVCLNIQKALQRKEEGRKRTVQIAPPFLCPCFPCLSHLKTHHTHTHTAHTNTHTPHIHTPHTKNHTHHTHTANTTYHTHLTHILHTQHIKNTTHIPYRTTHVHATHTTHISPHYMHITHTLHTQHTQHKKIHTYTTPHTTHTSHTHRIHTFHILTHTLEEDMLDKLLRTSTMFPSGM